MHASRFLLPTLLTLAASTPPLFSQTAPNPAQTFLAGLLTNDARDTLRNSALPPASAATQASILLESAASLDPADLRTLHLLAQTAQAAGRTEARRAALRRIIAADPGDLVAQTQYIDLLADASQTAEERAQTYRSALGQVDLDPQVRSEVALRLARLAEGRGDAAACKEYLTQSIRLNDINISALRDLVRLTAAEPPGEVAANRNLQALSTLLVANPYQPDAWLQVARICSAANVHDRAAEFLQTALEQFQIDGTPASLDLYLELAIETAVAGRPATGYTVANNLAQLPDAPLALLLVGELLSPYAPPSAPATTTSQPGFDRPGEIRRRLGELASDPADPAALADAAGADLTIFQTPGAETAAWIEAYAKLVQPTDPTLTRLRGWLLYRQNKPAEAQVVLRDSSDPLARLCMARIALDLAQPQVATGILQELWNANPTGLLALQIALAAAQAKAPLTDSTGAKALRPLLSRLTPALSGMHRQPRDAQLIMLNYRKPAVGPLEPVPLQIRITNTSDRPLPVGPDGVVKTTVGMAAATVGADSRPLGLYAIEDLQRVYRLEPHQMLEATVRVDQGRLADLLEQNPTNSYTVNVSVITVPRVLSAEAFSAGVGGQAIVAGDFKRGALSAGSPAELNKLVQEITSLSGDAQLIRIGAAGAILAGKPNPDLTAALLTAATSRDPLLRAAVLRAVAPGAPEMLERALQGLATDDIPLVRLLWARRAALTAEGGGPAAESAVAALEKGAASERDPLLKEYLAALLPQARAAATRPAATAPAAPDTTPAPADH